MCPKAVDILQEAVGMSLREENWEQSIMKKIGRKGCQHFAEILIECGRSIDQARMAKDLDAALQSDPSLDHDQFKMKWVEEHPEIKGPCMARA